MRVFDPSTLETTCRLVHVSETRAVACLMALKCKSMSGIEDGNHDKI